MEQLNGLRMQHHEQTMRQMVAEVHQGTVNITQAAAKFEVNIKTVRYWLDKVENEADVNLTHVLPQAPSKTSSRRRRQSKSTEIIALETKIRSLEQELETAQFKAIYYSTLVRVAEQELGMDIEKKSVTKQSGSCS
jgi:transposase-like protein